MIGSLLPAILNTIYDKVEALALKTRTTKSLNALESFLLGVLASSIAITLTFPIDLARCVIQSRSKTSDAELVDEQGSNVLSVLRWVFKKKGFFGLFSGLLPALMQGCLVSGYYLPNLTLTNLLGLCVDVCGEISDYQCE